MVGQIIATKMVDLGHQVTMGTRDPEATRARTEPSPMTGRSFADWYAENSDVQLAVYPEAAVAADLIVNATSGGATLAALEAVGKEALAGKILLDLANPLDFSQGMPPFLSVCNTDSLGEQIQQGLS